MALLLLVALVGAEFVRLPSGSMPCEAKKYIGPTLVAWSGANITRAALLLEAYYDAPLLPRSYFHKCASTSKYALRIYSDEYHGPNAFFGKVDIYAAVAARCASFNHSSECLCEQSSDYARFAFMFILTRIDSHGLAPVVDLDAVRTAQQISTTFAAIAAFVPTAKPPDATKLASILGLSQISAPQQISPTFLAKNKAAIATCFMGEWGREDWAVMRRYFPELPPPPRGAPTLAPATTRPLPTAPPVAATTSTLPPDVHVLIPCRAPANITRSIVSLRDKADRAFGSVKFHFGLDWGDASTRTTVTRACEQLAVKCFMHDVYLRKSDISGIVNHMFASIETRGYFFRFNDDSEVLTTNWNRLAIQAIRQPPVDIGLAGVIDIDAPALQTHSFVSSAHRDIFGLYFPAHFKNYYEDDWITGVYAGELTKQAPVRVAHRAGKPRFSAQNVPSAVLGTVIDVARKRVDRYLQQIGVRPIPTANDNED